MSPIKFIYPLVFVCTLVKHSIWVLLLCLKEGAKMPLNSNALIKIEEYLIYSGKYKETALTAQTLTTVGSMSCTFPNTYLVEGTVIIKEGTTVINSDIDVINYTTGNVTFKTAHGALTANYTYLAFNYSKRYMIEQKINAVSNAIEKYTGRKLKSATYTDEEHIGNYKQLLQLRQYPVTALTTVKIDDAVLDSTSYSMNLQDAERGRIYKADGWTWEGYLTGYVGEPTAPLRSIKVTYTAGYTDIPADIKDVVCQMVDEAINIQSSGGAGLKQIVQGELSYTYGSQSGYNDQGLSLNYAQKLDKYRNYIVGGGM